MRRFHFVALAIVVACTSWTTAAFAQSSFNFTLDSEKSVVSIGGNVVGLPLRAQDTGSLTTGYSGTLSAQVTGNAISLMGGNLSAMTNGTWTPDSPTASDYGGLITDGLFTSIDTDIQNLAISPGSGPLSMGSDGTFAPSGITISFLSGVMNYKGAWSGTLPMSGSGVDQSASPAQYSVSGNTATLIIPVDATLSFSLLSPDDTQVTLQGQLVGTAVVPDPAACSLFVVAGSLIVIRRRTRA